MREPYERRNTILTKALISLLLSLITVSCAYYSPIYWGWGEWVGSDVVGLANDSIVTLDWSAVPGVITLIDQNQVGAGYKKAKLAAGSHVIEYAYYPAEFGVHPRGTIELHLAMGHAYEFRLKLCFWCIPRKYAAWVEDKTTSEDVWGKPPDWPSWYL